MTLTEVVEQIVSATPLKRSTPAPESKPREQAPTTPAEPKPRKRGFFDDWG